MHSYSDPAILARLNANSGAQGFNQWFGVEGLAAGNGQVEITVPIREDLRQHHGYVHGGCVGALADMACAWAAATTGKGDVVTASLNVHFLRPATGDLLRAKARTIRAGRTLATVEADVYAETEGAEPILCATALASIAILPASKPA